MYVASSDYSRMRADQIEYLYLIKIIFLFSWLLRFFSTITWISAFGKQFVCLLQDLVVQHTELGPSGRLWGSLSTRSGPGYRTACLWRSPRSLALSWQPQHHHCTPRSTEMILTLLLVIGQLFFGLQASWKGLQVLLFKFTENSLEHLIQSQKCIVMVQTLT